MGAGGVGLGNGFGGCAYAETHTTIIIPTPSRSSRPATIADYYKTRVMIAAHRLADYCHDQQDWLLETIAALVTRESPTDDKAAVDRCGVELSRRLVEVGARVTELSTSSAGNHVRAEFGSGSRQVMLLGHFDTVWPVGQLQRMPYRQRGDHLEGPGVLDMKAGLALGVLATRALMELAPPAKRTHGDALDG